MNHQYLAIEGNIGAGKTSLAKKIAKEFDARLILEEFEENSFLPKFYENGEKYAFPLELSFLAERFQQLREKLTQKDLFQELTVADYFINKSLIFARRTLPDDLYSLYANLFEIISLSIPPPDLLVYLHLDIDQLQENIKKRGRSYEQSIQNEYLSTIQEGYFDFIKTQKEIPVVIIDTHHIDFVHNVDDYQLILDIISQQYSPGTHRIEPKK